MLGSQRTLSNKDSPPISSSGSPIPIYPQRWPPYLATWDMWSQQGSGALVEAWACHPSQGNRLYPP